MKEKIFLILGKLFKCKRKEIILIFLVCIFFLVSILIISNGYLLLGGEGNYFTNFKIAKESGSVLWSASFGGIGFASPTINGMSVLNLFLFLQNLAVPIKIINTLSVFLIYVLPFLSILWLFNRILKINFFVSFMVSLFYILNPFSTNHLQGLMLWNVAPFVVLPLIFGLIYKYYLNGFKLFFIFGLATSFFAFSFANIPYLGIFHIFLIISVVIISYIRDIKLKLRLIFKNFLITEVSFFLFNLWWLLGLMRFYLEDLKASGYSSMVVNWVKVTSGEDIVNKIFSIKEYLSSGSENFFSIFYFSPFVIPILFIPIIVLVVSLWEEKRNRINYFIRKKSIVCFIFLLVVIFLNKGYSPPLGELYLWMMVNVPFFEIFKTPMEKFSVLFVFLLSLNLALVFCNVKNKFYYGIFIFYLIICSIPYITLNFIPEYKVDEAVTISRKFINKEDYINSENIINNEKTDYRYLSLPGSLNYQETLKNHDGNKYYQGMNPIVYAINKPFIAAYSGKIFDPIYNNLSSEKLDGLLSLYNIKRIMINSDIYPSFGFKEVESVDKLDKIFSKRMKKIENGPIKIYNSNYFLPHLYVPQNIISSKRNPEDILRITSQDKYNISSAIFFKIQNGNKNDISSTSGNNEKTPVIEFKKIDQAKYRIKIHGANNVFPLVFSESFHEGWKSYLVKPNNFQIRNPKSETMTKIQILKLKTLMIN